MGIRTSNKDVGPPIYVPKDRVRRWASPTVASTAAVVAADWSGDIRVGNAADGKWTGHIAPNPPTVAQHLAEAQARLSARARTGRAVNLDPAALVMDMVLELAQLPPAASAPPSRG